MHLKKHSQVLKCFILLLGLRLCSAQSDDRADLAKRIQQGSPQAMLEAGDKGATDFIPLLRMHLTDVSSAEEEHDGHYPPRVAAQLALAKLGSTQEQRQVKCELVYGNLPEQARAFEKIEYIGGWFEISTLTPFLADGEYNSRMLPEPGAPHGDATVGTRQELAVRALDAMSLPLPKPASSAEHPLLATPKRAKLWLRYIQVHQHHLKTLLPTGKDAAVLQNFCESYLSVLGNRPDSYIVIGDNGTVTTIKVEQRGFGARQGYATFNGNIVPVSDWKDSWVTVELPSHTSGKLEIVKADSKMVSITIH